MDDTTSPSRAVKGIAVGMLMGLALCVPWARAVNGMLWVPGTVLQANAVTVFRYVVPFVLGGGAAGALIGALLPRMRRVLGAFWVTSAALGLYLLAGRLGHLGVRSIETEFLLFTAAAALAGGFRSACSSATWRSTPMSLDLPARRSERAR